MIFLIEIVKASFIKASGMDKVLEPIVESLFFKKNGVQINGEKIYDKLYI